MPVIIARALWSRRAGRFVSHLLAAQSVIRWLVAPLLVVALAACGDDNPPGPNGPAPPRVARVVVTPVDDPILVGQSVPLTATPRTLDDEVVAGVAITWQSADASIATVSAAGVVEGRGAGVVEIRAEGGGKTGTTQVRVVAPPPPPAAIASVSPAEVMAGTPTDIGITVTGTGFTATSAVALDGIAITTTWVSPTELRALVPFAAMAVVRVRSLTVVAAGAEPSNAIPFPIVEGPTSMPFIDQLNPSEVVAGTTPAIRMLILGRGFGPRSQVTLDDAPLETEYVSATRLRATITPEAMRTARARMVAVVNTGPGGGEARSPFTVTPVPVARVELSSPKGAAWTWANDAIPLEAIARDAQDRVLTDRVAAWSVSDETIAWPNASGDRTVNVYGRNAGQTRVGVRVGDAFADRTFTVLDAPRADLAFVMPVGTRRRMGLWSPGRGVAHELVRVPHDVLSLSPSPDGRSIAYAGLPENAGVDGNADIYITNRDASRITRVTEHPAADIEPAWSPDGSTIAFTSARGANGLLDVWVMNADGSAPRQLTEARIANEPLPHSGNGAGSAAWSPDGAWLAYTVARAATLITPASSSIWIMRADGSGKRQLTNGTEGLDYNPTWSRDGLFVTFSRVWRANNTVQLFTVSAATGASAFPWLHNAFVATGTPSYSPDGQWITASHVPGGNAAPLLYVLPMNNSVGPRILNPASVPNGVLGAKWLRRP